MFDGLSSLLPLFATGVISALKDKAKVFEHLRYTAYLRCALAAVEIVPRVSRQKFIQRVWQRGHRFLKQFRLRLAQRQTLSRGRSGQSFKLTNYEHQHQTTRRISV